MTPRSAFHKPLRPRKKPSWLLMAAAALLILAAAAPEAWACPMCKAALGSHDRNHGDWVGGFFWSILFMLSMPFVLFGSLSAYMYVLVRRARQAQAEKLGRSRLPEGLPEIAVDEATRGEPAITAGR